MTVPVEFSSKFRTSPASAPFPLPSKDRWLTGTQPFPDAESAWFWCLETSEAVHNGARLRAGMGTVSRPCEPVDIQTVVIRLARQRLLNDAHLRMLCFYGPQQMRPAHPDDLWLWQQAMDRLTPILQRKGIIR